MPESNQDIKRFFKQILKLRHLRTIAMLAEMGQVSRVAQELNVTQPAISKQIGEIERALKTPIVQRQGNRIVLTPIGERLATHAREVVQQIERAEFDVDALHRGLGGRVVVGVVTSIAPTLLPEAIRLLKITAPPAIVSVVEGHFNQLLPMLESGGLDLLIARVWEPVFREGIEQATLLREPILLVAGVQHPLAGRQDIDWKDAVAWPWISPAAGSLARQGIDAFLARSGLAFPPGHVESTSLPLNIELMRISPFISLMPQWLARHHAGKGDLTILPLQMEGVLSEARCYWKRESSNATSNLFRECLEQASRQSRFAPL
ncbi:LysR family transcriptional regulator [Billgrantia sp. Q4P2]|uniref:LysR family transcriptional regulator n=1 Tax=Billgrantia sp. Q4P2 TaxID=3463857 RepID=UPI0040569F31